MPGSEREVLATFASFGDQWQRERSSVETRADSTLRNLLGSDHGYEVMTETARNRRFSGDGSLRRKKYFSVCEAGSDDDQGTMLRELLSYDDPSKHGAAEVTETAGNPGEMEIALSRYACEPPISSNRHLQRGEQLRKFPRPSYRIPIRVLDEQFERVIDLRRPATAEWFTSNLTRLRWLTGDKEQLAFPRKAPLEGFHELLPSLVTQARGGGYGATRIAGAWLRVLGADALVFPSARSDSMLEADHGETLKFRGWSLVDFRGEPPPRALTVDFTSEWSRVALQLSPGTWCTTGRA